MQFTKSSAIVSIGNGINKVSGFIRDILIASFLGASNLADLLLISMRLPYAMKPVISDEYFNAAYIPISASIKEEHKKYSFAKQVLMLNLIILTPFTLVVEFWMPEILEVIARGKVETESFELLILSSRLIFPVLIVMGVNATFIAMLHEKNKFFLATLLPMINSLAIIFAIIFYNSDLSINRLLFIDIFICLSFLIQLYILLWSTPNNFWAQGSESRIFSNKIIIFLQKFWPLCLVAIMLFLQHMFWVYIASFTEGALSYFYYAERLFFLPIVLIARPIATVMIPNLSRALIDDMLGASQLQRQALKYMFIALVPLAMITFFASDSLVVSLFERGEFNSTSSRSTALMLKILAVGMPGVCISMLLRPYFYAAQRTTVLLKITTFTCLMDVAIVLILYKYYGFLSIAITISLTSYITGLILFLAQMQGKFIKINMKLIQYFLQYICFCVILFLILYFISKSLIIFSAGHLISLMVLGFIYILSCIIMVIIFDRHLLQVTIKRIGSMIKGI